MSAPTEDATLVTLKWGTNALPNNVTGQWIVAIGKNALRFNEDCDLMYAIGDSALGSAVTGCSSCGAIGQGSIANLTTGICNWGFGVETLFSLVEGSSNTAGGQASLRLLEYGDNNTAWGEQSGSGLTSGGSNLFIGYTAGSSLVTGDGNICIGANAQPSSTDVNYECTLGGAGITKTRLRGEVEIQGEIVGKYTTPSFNSTDFTSNAGSWTVDSGDITTNDREITGKKMTMDFTISNTSVSGSPLNLRISTNGKTIARRTFNACRVIDNGVDGMGYVRAKEGDQYIEIYKAGTVAWSNSTNNTAVLGQITFEIQ